MTIDKPVTRWDRFSAFVYTLWICRIATSFAAMALVFVFVPQARDMLLDVRYAGAQWYWPLFFVFFTLWFLSVYISARLAIESNTWAVRWPGDDAVTVTEFKQLRERYGRPVRWLPVMIPLAGAVIVSAAFARAWALIPDTGNPHDVERLGGHLGWSAVVTLGIAAIISLVIAAFYWRRQKRYRWPPFLPHMKLVDGNLKPVDRVFDPEEYDERNVPFIWLRRVVLGSGVVLLVILLLFPQMSEEIQRAALAFLLLTVWIPVLTGLSELGNRVKAPVIFAILVVLTLATTFLWGDNHAVRAMVAANPTPEQRPTLDGWIDAWAGSMGCSTGTAVQPAPCPRPIIVVASGGASRAAFFTASTLGKLMDLACPAGACPAAAQNPFVRQVFAISSVSGSTLGAVAWATALDRWEVRARRNEVGLPCRSPRPDDGTFWVEFFRVPANFARRVLDRFVGRQTPSVELDRYTFDYWHLWRVAQQDRPDDLRVGSWQDCLELAVAGDYLSAPVAQLFTRDIFPSPLWSDRNVALEDAFDTYASRVFQPAEAPSAANPSEGSEEQKPFSAEFLSLWRCQIRQAARQPVGEDCALPALAAVGDPQPSPGSLGAPGMPMWRPLVISNGASVPYGNRILTSPIRMVRDEFDFLDATDAYNLINAGAKGAVRCGLRIKTVVLNSARFPGVSTEGDFPAGERAEDCSLPWKLGWSQNLDQVVDGGYFESVGVTSAYDVAVRLAEKGMKPLVLVVTNDPEVDPSRSRAETPDAAWEGLGGAVTSPVEAVLEARSGRGVITVEALRRLPRYFATLDSPAPSPEATAFIGVRPPRSGLDRCKTLKDLSMSWWLSLPVQTTLRNNVTAGSNADGLRAVCTAVGVPADRCAPLPVASTPDSGC